MTELQAPLIELGFFWSSIAEPAAFGRLVTWLLAAGSVLRSPLRAVRADHGQLPWFRCPGLLHMEHPEIECGSFEDWTPDRFANERDWLPIHVRLAATTSFPVDVDVCYATLCWNCRSEEDIHPIEIVASGADLDLAHNVDSDKLDDEILENARRTDEWTSRTFRSVCEEFGPDYAGYHWERSLRPPRSLVASDDWLDFGDLFLSDTMMRSYGGPEALQKLEEWHTERYRNGIRLTSLVRDDPSCCREGMDLVRKMLRAHYGV